MTDESSSPISGGLYAVSALSALQKNTMFELLCRHFHGVTRQRFDADLSEKNWTLLLRDGMTIVGFSTMLVRETCVRGHPITVLYSGDTIVDPSAWASAALPREWISAVWQIRDHHAPPLYWLLLTSGFRTYRLLSTFWQSFYPHYNHLTPPESKLMLDFLALEQYGDAYDANTGIVRFTEPQVLRAHLAGIPEPRRADPHVDFFMTVNPGHARGDELACLCKLDEANLSRAGRRVVFGSGKAHA